MARLPWAALLAGAIVIGADRFVLEDHELWKATRERLEELPPGVVQLEVGITKDRLQLANMRKAPDELDRVIVMGNSRARVGLVFPDIDQDGVQLAKVAHAAVSPFVMRSFAPEAAALEPDLVVLMLSELDTQRPVVLIPSASFGNLPAVGELLLSDPSIAAENRLDVEQLVLGCLLQGYRYRDVFGRAWLNELREFPIDKIEPKRPGGGRRRARRGLVQQRERTVPAHLRVDPRYKALRPPPTDDPLPDVEGIEELVEELRADPSLKRKRLDPKVLSLLVTIGLGEHSRTQEHLVESTIEILTAAGSTILIVEGPLHPLAHRLYDYEATRPEFLAFVERLKEEYGVLFLPLEESGPIPGDEFADLLHLGNRGTKRLSAHVRERMLAILAERDSR